MRRPLVNKKALVHALDGEALRHVLLTLGVDADVGSPDAMRSALAGSHTATARRILAALDADMRAMVVGRVGYEQSDHHEEEAATRVPPESRFVAIDFETADGGADSACAVAMVRVHGDAIVDRAYRLIRPPRKSFTLSWVHGLTWDDVANSPTFGPVWTELMPMLEGVHFVVAHNAGFDRAVLRACCRRAGLPMPGLRFKCTVKWSRRTFDLPRVNLPTVCEHLGIELDHHHALSDAEACARVMMEVQRRWRETVRG